MPTVQLSNGLHMFYRESGSGDRVVLFVHGNSASSRWWERLFTHLPADLRAIALDLRACGDTARAEGDWTWQQLVDDVYQFAQARDLQQFVLVGHSLGGTIAQQFTADHPELVEKLVMINPGPPEGFHFPPEWYTRAEMLVAAPAMMKMALAATAPTAPKDEFLESLLDESVAKSSGAWIRNTRALEQTGSLPDRIKEISAPTLIIYGMKDMLITPGMMERLQTAIAGAVLDEWEGIGHSAPVEAPERAARRIAEFL